MATTTTSGFCQENISQFPSSATRQRGSARQAALDAGVEEVYSSHSCEPSGMAGRSVDQSVQAALQDVGIKLRQDPLDELSCAHF